MCGALAEFVTLTVPSMAEALPSAVFSVNLIQKAAVLDIVVDAQSPGGQKANMEPSLSERCGLIATLDIVSAMEWRSITRRGTNSVPL